MAILSVPNIVILEPIDIHVKRVIGVEIHVSNEEMSDKPSVPPSFEYSQDCILFGTSKSTSSSHQLAVFFKKIHPLFCKTYPTKISNIFLDNLDPKPCLPAGRRSREFFQDCHFIIQKNPSDSKCQSDKRIKGIEKKGTEWLSFKPAAEPPSEGDTQRAKHCHSRTDGHARKACHRSRKTREQRRNLLCLHFQE